MEGKKLLDLYTALKGEKQAERSPADLSRTGADLSRTGADLIKGEEAFVPHLYDDLDNKRRLTKEDIINKRYKGTPTIGYGTTFTDEELTGGRKDIDIYGEIDRQTANRLFKEHPVMKDSKRIIENRLSKDIRDSLTQEQEDALYSFGYNAGAGALNKIIDTWNREGLESAVNRLKLYNKSKGKTLKGLIKRRNQEAEYLMKNKKYADGGLADLYRADRSVIQSEPEIVAQDDVKLAEDLIRMLEEAQMREPMMDGSELAFQDEKINPSDTLMSPEQASEMEKLAESENEPVQEPSRSIASTKEEKTPAKKLSPIESLLDEYKKLKGEYKDSKSQADLLSALSSVASTFDKYSPNSVGLQPMKVSPSAEKPELKEIIDMAKMKGLYKDSSKKTELSSDPNSPASIKARETLKKLGIKVPESMTQAEAMKFGTSLLSTERSKMTESGKDKRQGKALSLQERKKYTQDAQSALKDLRKDNKMYDKALTTLSTLPELEILLDDAYKNGGQSLAMLGPKIAKGIAGEVGVLTEQDVTRYVKNPQLVEGLMDSVQKIKSGKLTQASYDNIKRLLDISKKIASENRDTAIAEESELFSRRTGLPLEEARFMLDSNATLDKKSNESPKKKESGYDQETEIKIQRVIDNNPGASREEVIKQLKEAGKL